MHWIADHRLVDIADLDCDLAVDRGDRSEVSRMTVAADPDGGPFGKSAFMGAQPFVESYCAAADVSMSGLRHFQGLLGLENRAAVRGSRQFLISHRLDHPA